MKKYNIKNITELLDEANGTYWDINNPTICQKGKYEFKIFFMNNLVYYINTKPYKMTIDEYFDSLKEKNK